MRHFFYPICTLFLTTLYCFTFDTELSAQACPGLGSITLNVVAAPAPTLSAPAQLCIGAGGTVSVNQSFSTYEWSTGDNTQSIIVNAPGPYTVTVTNVAGCTGTSSVNINAAPQPSPSISQNPYTCNGQITLNAGAGFSSYSWSTAGSGQLLTVGSAGFYTVTVTNAQGCTGTDEFEVSIPAPPQVSITGNTLICSGIPTTLEATPGFSSYNWSIGGSGSTISVSNGGTYTVTATDAFGCTDTESILVTAQTAPSPTLSTAQLCPGGTATLQVTNAPFQLYEWSTGDTGSSTEVGTPGPYTVTVTAANGCTGTASTTVGALPAPSPSITQNTYACNGQITLNAGSGFSVYAWSNAAATPGITVNTSGTYTVTVTNAQGCTGTDEFNVDIPIAPTVSISGAPDFCAGSSAVLSASTGLVTYIWSNSQNGPSINISAGGTYTVTATDAFGCTATDNITVTQLPAPTPLITGPSAVCAGVDATLSTSTPFNAYEWSTGENAASILVNTAGLYTVTVTGANGCTGTDTQLLNVTPAPTPVITQATYLCNDQLTLNAGSGFSSYAWSNAGSSSSITVNTSGTYTVTVTNAQGCTGTDSFFADIPPQPSVSVSGDNSICPGENSTLSASAGFASYFWSNAASGQSITVNAGGNYTVTVTDFFGCTATDNINVSQLPAPAPQISGPASVCEGVNATLNANAGFNTYEWSTGENSVSILVGTAGLYTVTVTGANGCTGSDTQLLNVTPAPVPVISQATYLCDNQLILSATGTGFTSYNWNTSESVPAIIVTGTGTYTVTVSNAQGCTGTDSFFADIPPQPSVSVSGDNSICPGENSTLSASAGFASYFWSNAASGQSITVNAGGNYTVTVTDFFGCTATDEFSVSVSTAPTPNISGPSQICASGTATYTVPGTFSAYLWSTGDITPSITVNTANTYTVTVTATNGCTASDTQVLTVSNSLQPQITELPFACNAELGLDAGSGFASYSWSAGGNAQGITVNSDGTYTVTVTDAGGCTGSASYVVTIPLAPNVAISGVNNFCQGSSTNLTATPGLNSYVWNTAQVGNTINVNSAGTYSVTATDIFGCTATASFVVTTSAAPTVSISGASVICTGNSGILDAGTGFATYLWSNSASTPSINVSSGGTYTVTVTDANGCTNTDTQLVTEANGLSPGITIAPYACDGIQNLDAGSGYAVYSWSTGSATPLIGANADGTYTVTVSDAQGCTGTASTTISIPPAPQVNLSGTSSFCVGNNTTISATPGFTSYLWNNTETTAAVILTQGGVYTVTATDAFGCTDSASITVTAQPLPQPQIAGPTAICAGNAANFTLGQTFTTYSWSDGSNASSITANNPGTYSVTVTDANGCTGTDAVVLLVNNNPAPNITQAPYACDGQISLNADTGFVTYSWTGGGANATATFNSSGTYSVTVSDNNSCTGSASVSITVPVLNTLAISGPLQFCNGNMISLSAGSGFSTYTWSNNANTSDISVNAAGTYTVSASDAQGCTASASVTVVQLADPIPQISAPQAVCPGSTATLSVTQPFTTYQWSSGETTVSVTQSAPYTGTVTVTDANGCVGSATVTVGVSTQLTPVITQLPYACDGQISLNAGSGYLTYNWNTGDALQILPITQSGTYSVTVSDGNGCSGTASVQVQVPVIPSLSIGGDTQLCPGEISTLTANTGFNSYSWSNGSTANTTEADAPGIYTLTVTDALGCTLSTSISTQGLAAPIPVINGPQTVCPGASVTLTVSGSYSSIIWSDGTTGNTVTAPAPFSPTVTVTDVNGCTGSASTSVGVSNQLNPVINTLPYACDGQITLDAGSGYSTYLWSNGSKTQQISATQSATYSVTVGDGAGCSGNAVVQVSVPLVSQVGISGVNELCPAATGVLNAATGFTTYAWSNGQSNNSINVTAGTYTVTATDALGCSSTASIVVQALAAPAPLISGPAVICSGSPVTWTVGNGNFSNITWSTQATGASITLNTAGTYSVTVTDLNGCTASTSASVEASVLIPSLESTEIFCQGTTLTISVAGQYSSYSWSDGSSAPSLVVSQIGTYTVTVSDANGCTGSASTNIQAVPPPVVNIASVAPLCSGNTATLNTNGSVGTFVWSNGASGASLPITQPGTYTVTLTDANGCTASDTETVLGGVAVSNTIERTTCRPQDAGTDIFTYTSASGCDSVVTVITTYTPENPDLALDLESPISANAGAEITLDIKGNFTIDSVAYNTIFTLSCTDCLNPVFTAAGSGIISVTAFDADGCRTADEIEIRVNRRVAVYVPNVFKPGSTDNGFFSVFSAPEISFVRNFAVFDRWGNALFSRDEMPTNDPTAGWDGTFRGKAMQPGVYVYYFKLSLPDGSEEVFSGDVTILE
ncbi:MAG: gliding motility-associated C-terminal domain-containing protein [Chitinophagales bacterium]|nr:gliding motility-associated C-terminal domain-containing protein [Chitinophagales bacterium]